MWTRLEGEWLIPWDQSALRRDQISVKLLSPPLPVTSEFIDVGVSIIPDIEIGSHARPVSFGHAHRIGRATQSCAVVCLVTPSSALMRERKFWCDRRCHPCVATMTAVMVVSISPFTGASRATSNGRIRPEGRLRLDRLPATAKPAFFPCRQAAAFLAESKKSRPTPSSAALRA
jgi:hypothetical protein